MNENILLACRDAVIGYDNTVAVNGVSFELERGDYLCIVGENGSGKSTLLKGILGLIPMRGGSVDFADGLRRTDIGFLPQQTQASAISPRRCARSCSPVASTARKVRFIPAPTAVLLTKIWKSSR